MGDSTSPIPPWAEYLTPDQCAIVLQTTRERIIRLIDLGRLPATDIGIGPEREWMIPRAGIHQAHRKEFPPPARPIPTDKRMRLARRLAMYQERLAAGLSITGEPMAPIADNHAQSQTPTPSAAQPQSVTASQPTTRSRSRKSSGD